MGLQSYPVFTRKVSTDVSYQACAKKLFANADIIYPQFATHNALTAALVREMAGNIKEYELQRLHGMGEALHDSLVKAGVRSRIYAPVGGHRELLPYLVRRLLENGANSSFVNQLFDPETSVDDIVADPVEEIKALNVIQNTSIPSPRDLFSGTRLLAEGWDESDPDTAAQLQLAVGQALPSKRQFGPIIDGVSPKGAAAPSVNPAHKVEIIGEVDQAEVAHVALACSSAAAAQPAWAKTNPEDRGEILARAADMLEERAEYFMQLATREAGKTIPDSIAEIREAVDFLRHYGIEARRLDGQPLGVVACISPWNFPLAIFVGQVSAALAAGNAVIAKPAEQTPIIAHEAVKLLHEAGVPTGVLHFLPGDGPTVGGPLVRHPVVKGVVFTGSTEVAKIINRTLVESGKHDASLIAETGGINAMIIDSTALLEQAVRDVVASAFQSAGQRCSACRLVCVQDDIADKFNEMLAGAMAELSVGDPALLSTDVGPLIDEDACSILSAHIAEMEKAAKLIARATAQSTGAGVGFIEPAAYEIATIRDLTREVFGPVLHVVRFKAGEINAVIKEINSLGFGLTLGLHTRIDETMHEVVTRARIGNIYVNRNQIGAVVGVQPFGGEGLSGTGPKAGGPHYLSALQKAPVPADGAELSVSPSAPLPLFDQQLIKSDRAFGDWNAANDRREILARAAGVARDETAELFRQAISIFAQNFENATELPGPTGEANSLRMKGRGVVICLGGGSAAANRRQIALALAAGNAVLCSSTISDKIDDALSKAGAPAHLATGLPIGPAIHEAALLDPRIRAVVFDGAPQSRAAILSTMATRAGSIAPLLSSLDAPWRFATERTLTINTTAAGGDVRLLSLPE
jgi:RHH-type proline utilization regulon transcriptional repressor/proline dehydrogenase/delta 1-pyrroline-5-carboxylate dehydrogenase